MFQKTLLTAVAAVLMSGAGAQAAPIFSENFDAVSPSLSLTSAGSFSAISGTNVDVINNGSGYGALCAGPETGNCADLGGTGGNPNGILQSNTQFGPGTYLLSFDLVGSGRGQTDATTVSFGNFNAVFSLGTGDTLSILDVPVTLATSGYLTFSEDSLGGNGNIGNLLDNVSVTTAAVPEPLTFSVFGAGAAGAAALRQRKKTKVA